MPNTRRGNGAFELCATANTAMKCKNRLTTTICAVTRFSHLICKLIYTLRLSRKTRATTNRAGQYKHTDFLVVLRVFGRSAALEF